MINQPITKADRGPVGRSGLDLRSANTIHDVKNTHIVRYSNERDS